MNSDHETPANTPYVSPTEPPETAEAAAEINVPTTAGTAATVDVPAVVAPTREEIIRTLTTIFDPEIPVNIYDLGLIYGVEISEGGKAKVIMTLTSPNCPEAQSLPLSVKRKTEAVAGVTEAEVQIVWEPAWEPSKMSEAAKLALNMM